MNTVQKPLNPTQLAPPKRLLTAYRLTAWAMALTFVSMLATGCTTSSQWNTASSNTNMNANPPAAPTLSYRDALPEDRDHWRLADDINLPQSLVFRSPQLREIQAATPRNTTPTPRPRNQASGISNATGNQLPWYATRNDFLPSVEAGFQSQTVTTTSTITRDRQYIRHGRVYDNITVDRYTTEERSTVY